MKLWVETWGPLVTLGSTVTLVVVTAWYAALTRSLAKSSERAAKSAESAAQSAARSVAAAVASVPVDFDISPWYTTVVDGVGDADQPMAYGVQVACTGATVFVHGCILNWVGTGDHDFTSDVEELIELEPPWDVDLPARLHKSETIQFSLPRDDQEMVEVTFLQATVNYSLDGASPPVPRLIEWWAPGPII